MRIVIFRDLGRMDYKAAWDYQELLLQENIRIKTLHRQKLPDGKVSSLLANTQDHLLFVEHPPVYTLGKSGHLSNLLIDEAQMKAEGISFFQTNRGGDITFHGPGQVVGYPVLDLEHYQTDIGKYLRNLEEVVIKTLADYGIDSGRSTGETGVWLDAGVKEKARKICALGVRCSRWITMHGFALNVNTSLAYFDHIIPCGITDKTVTSMAKELGATVDFESAKEVLKMKFAEVFGVEFGIPVKD